MKIETLKILTVSFISLGEFVGFVASSDLNQRVDRDASDKIELKNYSKESLVKIS